MLNTNFLSLLSANLTCNMFKCLCCRGSILRKEMHKKLQHNSVNWKYGPAYSLWLEKRNMQGCPKISSCQVYVFSRRRIVRQGSTFDCIFFLFPIRVATALAHGSLGKSRPPALSDSPVYDFRWPSLKVMLDGTIWFLVKKQKWKTHRIDDVCFAVIWSYLDFVKFSLFTGD